MSFLFFLSRGPLSTSKRAMNLYSLCNGVKTRPSPIFSCSSFNAQLTYPRFTSFSSANKQDFGVIIYTGPIARRIRNVKFFSLTSSMFGLMVQPQLLEKALDGGISNVALIFSGTIIQFFTFVTPFLLHYITKRYTRVIYFEEKTDTYTALTYNFWATDKLISFKADDVVVPDIPGMFTSIIVKGNPLFIEVNQFEDISHYKRIMGYDKPIDFKLYEKPPK